MAGNPACEHFIPQLSPYVDGELPPSERVQVERHLTACRDCTGRAADLRAESALLRVGMDMAVDEADFKDFAQRVMARVTPEKPPLLERLRLSLSEMLLYQRTALVSSLATAAAALVLVLALPVLLNNQAPPGYGGERMRVRAVRASEGATLQPVVLEDEVGKNTIIWTVEEGRLSAPAEATGQGQDKQQSGGDLEDESEEETGDELPGARPGAPAGSTPVAPKDSRPTGGAL